MYFGLTEIKMEADFGDGNIHRVKCDFDAMNSDNDTGVAQVDQ
jgi:hypothetical protein